LTIEEACRQLGIEHTMFYELRTDVLKAGLAQLEPRPMGRPRRPTSIEDLHSAELQSRVEQLEAELKLSALREEIARVMPYRAEADPPGKKRPIRRRRPIVADRPGIGRAAAASPRKP
jgi:hypothetical protein